MPRIHTIQRCSQHSDGNAISRQTTAVSRRIDPLRQTTDHWPAGSSQNTTQMFCHAKAMVRGSTGSDHGHSAALTEPSKNICTPLLMEHQWGPIQLVQTLGLSLLHI